MLAFAAGGERLIRRTCDHAQSSATFGGSDEFFQSSQAGLFFLGAHYPEDRSSSIARRLLLKKLPGAVTQPKVFCECIIKFPRRILERIQPRSIAVPPLNTCQPVGVIRPSDFSSFARSMLIRLQVLRGLRGVNRTV